MSFEKGKDPSFREVVSLLSRFTILVIGNFTMIWHITGIGQDIGEWVGEGKSEFTQNVCRGVGASLGGLCAAYLTYVANVPSSKK